MVSRTRFALSLFTTLVATAAFSGHAIAQQGHVLDGFGGVHAVNGAAAINPATPYFGFDVAEAIQVLPGGQGYYVLDAFGGLHGGGNAPAPTGPPYFGFDIARDISLVPASSSGMVIASPGAFNNQNGSATQYQTLFGTSFSSTAVGAGNLFPTACTASDLFAVARASSDGSPRLMVGTESVSIIVMVNQVDTGLACTITTGTSQCSSAASVNVAAGARVGYKIVSTNINTSANGTFYVYRGFTCN